MPTAAAQVQTPPPISAPKPPDTDELQERAPAALHTMSQSPPDGDEHQDRTLAGPHTTPQSPPDVDKLQERAWRGCTERRTVPLIATSFTSTPWRRCRQRHTSLLLEFTDFEMPEADPAFRSSQEFGGCWSSYDGEDDGDSSDKDGEAAKAAGRLGGILHWSPELLHRPPRRSHQKRARGSEGRGGSCSAEEREAAKDEN